MQDMSVHTSPPCDHLEAMAKGDSADTPLQSSAAPAHEPRPEAAGREPQRDTAAPPSGDCRKQPANAAAAAAKSPPQPQEAALVAGARKRKSGKTVRHQMTALDSPDSSCYQCPMCSESVPSQTDLSRHLRLHTDQQGKLYICRVCNKALSSSSSLDRHLLVHTGEKPFKCQICGMAFSTNGNMHRHTRTHAHRDRERELHGDSSPEMPENSPKRRRLMPSSNNEYEDNHEEDEEEGEEEEEDEEKEEGTHCPMCNKDFPSEFALESHLEEMHPDYEIKCTECQLAFKNHRALNLHSFMVHFKKGKGGGAFAAEDSSPEHQTVGFTDLTFVDFSTQKFPLIARALCERSLHRPASSFHCFQCEACQRAFPCASALDIHNQSHHPRSENTRESCERCQCMFSDAESMRHHLLRCRNQTGKEGFFAVLDLQNKSEEDERADLADIQSILSVTRQTPPFLPKPEPSTTASSLSSAATSPISTRASPATLQTTAEVEEEDPFSAELREMKLRGEFPCRLCGAIFPNLRALKGHNRTHLSGAPYYCNMCDYHSPDKSTLIRHMRVHNGDRPFECAECNYAFTTKANCERHLRNRHHKGSRDEVRASIIFHQTSETSSMITPPPTNGPAVSSSPEDDTNCKLCHANFKLTYLLQEHMRSHHSEESRQAFRCRICHAGFSSHNSILRHSIREHPEIGKDPSVVEENSSEEERSVIQNGHHVEGEEDDEEMYNEEEEQNAEEMANIHQALVSLTKNGQSLHLAEAPLDLSMEALDLSRKRASTDQDEPEDLSKKKAVEMSLPEHPPAPHPQIQETDAKRPHLEASPHFTTPLALFYSSPFQSRPTFPLLMPIFPPALALSLAQVEAPPPPPESSLQTNATTRGLQLSAGGSLVAESTGGSMPFPMPFVPTPPPPTSVSSSVDTHCSSNNNGNQAAAPPTQKNMPLEDSNGMVKMVIKNGVLMKKQKQRRYRTERPFGCEFCSARFTLRSNMERHIKQQHPEHWSKRPRGSRRAGGNTGSAARSASVASNNNANAAPVASSPPLLPEAETDSIRGGAISEEVRQQLKQKLNLDSVKTEAPSEDEEEMTTDSNNAAEHAPLVIDEEKRVKMEPAEDGNGSSNKHSVKTREEEGGFDLVSVSRLLDNANTHNFQQFFSRNVEEEEDDDDEDREEAEGDAGEDSEGGCGLQSKSSSGSEMDSTSSSTLPATKKAAGPTTANGDAPPVKKKSAYSSAPHKVSCPYCLRKFPWTSSLHRHILTHTGQKPFKCPKCTLWFTTKSNRDRHLQRKHRNNSSNSGDASYTMRNVPERPYKCALCPSSTFSTQSNLKKHQASRHQGGSRAGGSSGSGREQSGNEDGGQSEDDMMGAEDDSPPTLVHLPALHSSVNMPGSSSSAAASPASSDKALETNSFSCYKCSQCFPSLPKLNLHLEQHSDLPFKCHLCEDSYAERAEALEHMQNRHPQEFEVLVAKGALEEEVPSSSSSVQEHSEENGDQTLRGKFPDYANRKVTCAFCMRKFWSAEDLRRHMRTHTGERPFTCNVCSRKFTLKHSMLRHRKKHQNNGSLNEGDATMAGMAGSSAGNEGMSDESMDGVGSGGEGGGSVVEETTRCLRVPPSETNGHQSPSHRATPALPVSVAATRSKKRENLMEKISKLSAASAISGARWGKDYAKLPTITPLDVSSGMRGANGDSNPQDDNDLISNLLGIPDKGMVDQLISKSANDAAKLLGLPAAKD